MGELGEEAEVTAWQPLGDLESRVFAAEDGTTLFEGQREHDIRRITITRLYDEPMHRAEPENPTFNGVGVAAEENRVATYSLVELTLLGEGSADAGLSMVAETFRTANLSAPDRPLQAEIRLVQADQPGTT